MHNLINEGLADASFESMFWSSFLTKFVLSAVVGVPFRGEEVSTKYALQAVH